MSRISVLEIISGFAVEGPLGGIERFGIELAQALDQEKFEVIVCGMWAYDTPYEGQWVEYLNSKGIRAFFGANWDENQPYKSFQRVVKNLPHLIEQVDIIHSHCQFGDGLALLMKKKLRANVLLRTVHNEREWEKRPLRRLLLTNVLYPLKFDAELGVAQQVVDNLNQRPVAKWRHKRALKSYNALNIDRFMSLKVDRDKKRKELGIARDAKVIGSIGRLTAQKAFHDLIDAFVPVLQQHPNSHLLIIGEGHLASSLKNQAQRLHISERVLFLGARNDIEELLSILNLFVNASHWEGLPTVIMESMAAGVPVIATHVGGNQELVKDKETGWIVPPHNPHQLSQTILEVLNQPASIRQAVSQRAKIFIKKNFSIREIAQQHEQLYMKLSQQKQIG